ncbi:response regulator [Pontibacter russatus]|uniref:response regulator n=1 Tax=Pontibacter russatus TaxID=2694929 RepID=UPI001379E726|nr:response regulator [Pontibacter russatus]
MQKVLVIEDDELLRENVAEMLELSHYQVYKAGSGKQGVEIALQQKPDIVICDIQMPAIDGYSVLDAFSRTPLLEAVPFIFLADRAAIPKEMESGADEYITKPFQESELVSAISDRLGKAGALKRNVVPSIERLKELIETARQYKELEYLTQDKKVYLYKRKYVLYFEGVESSRLFYVKKGKVKIYRTNQEGRELITEICKEGDFFGYLSLIEETEHQETAETMEDSEIVVIPKNEFLALLYQDRHVAKRLIKMLANSVSAREKLLSGMAYDSLRKRTADSLLFLDAKYKTEGEGSGAIQISRHDIAGIVGASTESLIRTLSDFKKERLIDMADGKILIVNKQRLQKMRN